MTALQDKGLDFTQAIGSVAKERDSLRTELADQDKKADALFTEVGNLKVALSQKGKELKDVKAALEEAKHDRARLEAELADRSAAFGREATLSYSVVSSVLEGLGAAVASIGDNDHEVPEDVFLSG